MESPLFSDTGIRLPIKPEGIAFDLDGTLLDYDGYLSESVAKSVRMIAESGIQVFLITGRLEAGCDAFWRQLELTTPLGTCNGAYIGVPGQEPVLHLRLSENARDAIMKLEKDHNLYVNYYIDNHVYSLSNGPDRDWYSKQFTYVESAKDEDDIRSRRLPTKILCIASEADHRRLSDLFIEALDGEANVTESNNRFIEILPREANKGLALRTISDCCGVPLDRFIAVGDAMNDKPMLEIAGFAVTFKSGNPQLAEYADMILPPLWEDGMNILARCVLGMTDSGRFLTSRSGRFKRV